MPALELLRRIAVKVTALHRVARFTCSACQQNAHCGLPPNDNCLVRALQIGSDGDYRARPPAGALQGVWPM
jgi:hypothetical protein